MGSVTGTLLKGAAVVWLSTQMACTNPYLHITWGHRFHEIFGVQASDRATQPPAAMRGDEERRVIGAYYESLAPQSGGGGGGGAQTINVGGTTLAPLTTTGSNSSSGVDLRAR